MSNITALREKIADLAKTANNQLAEKGSQTWTAEEQASFDNIADEIERTQAQIKSIERMRELDAEKHFDNAAKDASKKPQGDTIDAMTAVALYLRHGNNVSAEQAIAIRNAMSTTTPAEGGYTVPAEIASMVVDSLKAFGAVGGGFARAEDAGEEAHGCQSLARRQTSCMRLHSAATSIRSCVQMR